jgi:hypothetical protein
MREKWRVISGEWRAREERDLTPSSLRTVTECTEQANRKTREDSQKWLSH